MATPRSERPRFFEGQYIGAADLAAAVDYSRERVREAMLAGQSWGIAIGLDLVEVEGAGGDTEYFVLPGLAYDGFGRPLVVLQPLPVPPGGFADLATGNHRVWLRYAEAARQDLRPGWQTCGDTDSFARVRESVEVAVGNFPGVRDREAGVLVAGAAVQDARLALNAVDADAPMMCDGSVPHQEFPDDLARWLVPLGVAAWTMGAPGKLGPRSDAARKQSRIVRRYIGHVGEGLYAADGVLRLRDRFTQFKPGDDADALCGADAMLDSDLEPATDRDTGAPLDRLVGRELVWVEGHMRVTGDARMFGTRLELRDRLGRERSDVPLHLKRGGAVNASGGEDLELTLGAAADGKSRLIAGIAEPGQPFAPKLQLKNDGRLAVGSAIPADVLAHTILATTPADTSMAIASAETKTSTLQFAVGAALTPVAHIAYDHASRKLRLGSGTDLENFMYMTSNGRVGLKTETPEALDADADDLVVRGPTTAGMTLLCEPGRTGRINFADGVGTAAERHAGYLRYDHGSNQMQFGTAADTRVVISANGNMGIGTTAPTARLHIAAPPGGETLRIDVGSIRADNGGVAALLNLQSQGGGALFGGGLAAGAQVFISPAGRIGIGTQAPSAALHVDSGTPKILLDRAPGGSSPMLELADNGLEKTRLYWNTVTGRTHISSQGVNTLTLERTRLGVNAPAPDNILHVRGSLDGDANDTDAHIAFIENTSAGSADVLALKVNRAPNSGNNFITFFGSAGAVGRIEGNGGSAVAYLTTGADFAEFLPRIEEARIGPGRIVGVHGGRISLDTTGADILLVTTDRAAFVGNMPPGDAGHGERVAFMGQVQVWVENAVEAGDYIVPSGRHDGVGRAVAPDAIDALMAAQIVGRAWEAGSEQVEGAARRVNVAVGVGAAPVSGLAQVLATSLAAQGSLIAGLQAELAALKARLDD